MCHLSIYTKKQIQSGINPDKQVIHDQLKVMRVEEMIIN